MHAYRACSSPWQQYLTVILCLCYVLHSYKGRVSCYHSDIMPTHQYKCRQTHWHDCGWSILGKHGHCTGNLRNATMTSPTKAFPPHTSYRACNLTCTYPHSATHFEGCTCSHLQYNPTPTVCLSHLQTHNYSKEDIDASAHTHVHIHMHTCTHRYTWSHQRTSACNCGSDLQHIGTQMCQGSLPCTCVHTD